MLYPAELQAHISCFRRLSRATRYHGFPGGVHIVSRQGRSTGLCSPPKTPLAVRLSGISLHFCLNAFSGRGGSLPSMDQARASSHAKSTSGSKSKSRSEGSGALRQIPVWGSPWCRPTTSGAKTNPISGARGPIGTRPSPGRCAPAGRRRPEPGGSRFCLRAPGTVRVP
jgi:hypothetical protein